MRTGGDRICSIIAALRSFARLGEAEIKAIDIHEGLDSTILLLGHRLIDKPGMPAISIIRNYAKLPLIKCCVSELNQVFLNLLNIAIDALGRQFDQSPAINPAPAILLSTELMDEQHIAIQDNGAGISESIGTRLFEPFFTTKLVGQGMGLGLAINHQIIVEGHNGCLNYRSMSDQGVEFVIQLPITLVDN